MIAAFYLHTNYTRITHEKHEMERNIDWLIAAMCRGLAEYDANEIVPAERETDGRDARE